MWILSNKLTAFSVSRLVTDFFDGWMLDRLDCLGQFGQGLVSGGFLFLVFCCCTLELGSADVQSVLYMRFCE